MLTARVAQLEADLGKAVLSAKTWMMYHAKAAAAIQRARGLLASGGSPAEAIAILSESDANAGGTAYVDAFVDAMVKDWTEKPIDNFTRANVRDWINNQRNRTLD